MPTGFPATAWFYWIGGGLLVLFGLWLLYWSLLRDRARGRRRCPGCWYDMSGTASLGILICSECGKTAKRERKLFKTRRRWRWAMVAMLLATIGIVGSQTPKIQRDGWEETIPTTALITLNPYFDLPVTKTYSGHNSVAITLQHDKFEEILLKRLQASEQTDSQWCGLYRWQWWLLVRQSIRNLKEPKQPSGLSRLFGSTFDGYVLQQMVELAADDDMGPFAGRADTIHQRLRVSGRSLQRRSVNLVEWELVLDSQDPINYLIGIRVVPKNPSPNSAGVWIPRQLSFDFDRWGQPDRGPFHTGRVSWTAQSQGPAETSRQEFDVFVACFAGYPGPQWRRIGTIEGVFEPSFELNDSESATTKPAR